ncbi:class F sortase [Modestobacter sp. NPDC049651]|uniref:class F sortase n=1 Tax=unclassified Modestobacter TaxID=2643866 RepID=UPI0033E58921
MRRAVIGLAAGLAVAAGAPAAWAVTRPEPAAGVPVAAALAAAPGTTPAGTAPATAPPAPPQAADALPPVTVRDAAPPRVAAAPPAPQLVAVGGATAPVDPVGVTRAGLMELPGDVDRVGWYRYGPVPGRPGSAVIAGHVDDVRQGLGALGRLRTVEPGDPVEVTDAAGTVTRWTVVSRELLDKQALPVDALFARTGDPRLVLVTCGGPFDADRGSYRDNVVVVAVPA